MPTDHAHTIEMILAVYVEAKLDVAARELLQAKRWVDIDRNPYTEGKLLWANHQYAAVKIVARDVASWKSVVKRYRKKLKKRIKANAISTGSDPIQPSKATGTNAVSPVGADGGMGSLCPEAAFDVGE